MRNLFFVFIILSSLLVSCDGNRVFEKNADIAEDGWDKKDTVTFEFEISDPALSYNLYYQVRYSNSYSYYNLFTKYFLADSSGKIIKTPQIPEDMYLFDPKTGQPYGKGLGDIYDQRISFLKDYKFPKAGKYKIKAVQYMREEKPLPGIVSFGIRIEKAEK